MKKLQPNVARIDRATPKSEIFRVLPKDNIEKRKRLVAVVKLQSKTGSETEVRFVAPYELDHMDQRVYLALVGLMSMQKPDLVKPGSSDALQKNLWDKFFPENLTADYLRAPRIRTTILGIAKAAGITWGKGVKERILGSLDRLSMATAKIQNGNHIMSANMISYAVDTESQEIAAAVSPLLASAILGEARQYIRVNLEEMRALKHPASTVLHLWLTARHVGPGANKDQTYSIDKLAEIAYGKPENDQQKRERRKSLRTALVELDMLQMWSIALNSETGRVNISKSNEKAIEMKMLDADRIHKELDAEE